ncbi:hypothetical protein ACFWOJ_24325 [Streptomyces sp. NPDC058439]|uniref:hypothetical protein n=1 Tax=Streptomyces sp. NPDC058439 TaxID=3346500 RepID=UPI00364D67D6
MTLASHFAAHALRPTDVSATRADAIASTGPVSRPWFHTTRSAAPDTDSATRLLQDNDHARQHEGQVLEVLRQGRADVGKDEAAAREADSLGTELRELTGRHERTRTGMVELTSWLVDEIWHDERREEPIRADCSSRCAPP